MASAFLITLREGLEAALIVGIVLSVLRRLNQTNRARQVWFGVGAAVLVSIVAAVALQALGVVFEGRGEQIYEGIAMLLAAGVLTRMIFWMQDQGQHIEDNLEAEVSQATDSGSAWTLFGIAFVAVLREGVETAIFMSAAVFAATGQQSMLGGGLGLVVAACLGWLMFAAGKSLDVGRFFRATGVLLLLFAAGLVAHGVHEFQEAGWLPTIIEPVWDLGPFLDENSLLGSFLKALFGYNGNPSLIEVISYLAYLAAISFASLRAREQRYARVLLSAPRTTSSEQAEFAKTRQPTEPDHKGSTPT